jgi:NAD(P)-dependent dehydrogenase (short-subunit alcohol dehydrogenase family)
METKSPMNYVVTGAARGIGRGLTRSLLSHGHNVFLIDSNEVELAHTLTLAASWVSSHSTSSGSPSFRGQLVDLSNRAQIKRAVGEVARFFDGKLDVLVNNAFPTPHIWADGKAMDDDLDSDEIMAEWDTKVAVGLTAPFLLSRLCVPLLTAGAKPGCIINVSSTRARQAEDNHEAYSAAKAGLLGLTQSMAVSLGHKHGIRVNAIIAGWISVDNENKAADEKGTQWEDGMGEADHKWHPAGRVGKVEDVAKTVDFLAESDFVTGEEIVLDGGVTRKIVYPEE